MKFAVITFPCSAETDIVYAIKDVLQEEVELVSHELSSLDQYDAIVLPGGASYGDYLRPGAVASIAPIMKAVAKAANEGKPILGIGNGFQILTEAGLLPGALLQNQSLKFICKTVLLEVGNNSSIFTNLYEAGEKISIPIAHGWGRYHCDEQTLENLKAKGQIVFQYLDNPNGSVANIAGIVNEQGNVLGMMPLFERAVEAVIGGTNGLVLFCSILAYWREAYATTKS